MSKRDSHRALYESLDAMNLLDYGSTIPQHLVYELLDIQVPETASKSVFDSIALAELSAIDYVRNILLAQGKYITSTSTGYRVLLPSENKKQCELYVESADRKLNRALKLSRNTPVEPGRTQDQTEVRILMKRDALQSDNRFRANG